MSNSVCTYKSKLRNKEDFQTLIFSLPEVNNYCVNVIGKNCFGVGPYSGLVFGFFFALVLPCLTVNSWYEAV